MRYHAKQRMESTGLSKWVFEPMNIPIQPMSLILVHITVENQFDGQVPVDLEHAATYDLMAEEETIA